MECTLPTFSECSEPVARKRHRCCECDAPIEVGERHLYVRGKWDGRFSQYRQHLLCEQACELIRDELNDGECIGFGTLFEFWVEVRREARKYRDNEWLQRLRRLMTRIRWRERAAGTR